MATKHERRRHENKYAALRPLSEHQPTLAGMCREKVRYGSTESALRARGAMAAKTGEVFSAYHCPFCRGYHVGHRPGTRS